MLVQQIVEQDVLTIGFIGVPFSHWFTASVIRIRLQMC
jgi:hypothetical protein